MILAGLIADQSAPRGTAPMEANFDRLANMVVDMDRGEGDQGSITYRNCAGSVLASWTKSGDPAASS